jgi:hypothetical protein
MKNLQTKDWLLIAGEAGLFFIVTIVIWLDEFVDLPYRLLGAPPTPHRPQEYILPGRDCHHTHCCNSLYHHNDNLNSES